MGTDTDTSGDIVGRARFIEYRGKRIYLIDCEGMTPEETLSLIPVVARAVQAEPPGSVLTLTHVKDVRLDSRVNHDLRELAKANAPHVKAAAVTGLAPLQVVVVNLVKAFSQRDFRVFGTKQEGLDYLASVG